MIKEEKDPIQVFIGYEPRQPIAFHVLAHSIWRQASREVLIRPLILAHLPITRRGLTDFTYSRFLVPHLSGFKGISIFIDSDFLCLGDVAELADMAREFAAETETDVMVVKNQLRFEWASMMVFRNYSCLKLRPKFVQDDKNALFDFAWARNVKELPKEWNHLVGYDEPNPAAKLVHFTQGIPYFSETRDSEFAAEWMAEANSMGSTVTWQELMGKSVHAGPVIERLRNAE